MKAWVSCIEARKRKGLNLRGRPEDMLLMALVW